MRFRPLSRDPFMDIGRTIPEFRSVGLAVDKKNFFLRSMAKLPDSCSNTPRSMSTCSPVIRPLTNNTTRLSALTTRSILQLIFGLSVQSFHSFYRSGLRRTGFVKHVCRAQLLTHDSRRSHPIGFPSLPGVCFTEE